MTFDLIDALENVAAAALIMPTACALHPKTRALFAKSITRRPVTRRQARVILNSAADLIAEAADMLRDRACEGGFDV